MHRANLEAYLTWPLPNVWIGTSIAEQKDAARNIPILLKIPAAVRFLSIEPLISPVNIGLTGTIPKDISPRYLRVSDRIHWVIVGGESGHGARPCNVEWIRAIVAECRESGVPCFVKQLGREIRTAVNDDPSDWGPEDREGELRVSDDWDDFGMPVRTADSKGGDWDEWPFDLRVREFPEVAHV